jgi:signal recognition particle receptor subunit beta
MLKFVKVWNNDTIFYEKTIAFSFYTKGMLDRLLADVKKEMAIRGYYNAPNLFDLLNVRIIIWKILKPFPLTFAYGFDDSILPEKNFIFIEELKKEIVENAATPEKFHDIIESHARKLLETRSPKICIVGDNGVGKTCITHLLKGENPPETYIPTAAVDKSILEVEANCGLNVHIHLWDFYGDLNEKLFKRLILGSDAVIVVLDSQPDRIKNGEKFFKLTKEVIPHAEILAIANMQDKEGALSVTEIESKIGYKVFPMVAIDKDRSHQLMVQVQELIELLTPITDYTDESFITQRND